MVKYSNFKIILITFLTLGIQAELNLKCIIALQQIQGYECLQDEPIGSGTSSVAFLIRKAKFIDEEEVEGKYKTVSDAPRVLKISETSAKNANEDPEVKYLQINQNSNYVIQLLENPSIQKIDGKSYLYEMLEFAPNGDIEKFMKKDRDYFKDDNKLFDFAEKLVEGLESIHKNNIIHASVKAQNVIVTDNYIPKYIDFNNSIYTGTLAPSRGDHLFNAPEVVDRTKSIVWTEKQDIYSLGVLFYYLVHRDVPFNGITRYFHKRAVEKGIYYFNKDINTDFVKIIQSCMRLKPEERISLDKLKTMIKDAKDKHKELRKKLESSQSANLIDFELSAPGFIRTDPLLLLIVAGILIIIIALIALLITFSNKEIITTDKQELYQENRI